MSLKSLSEILHGIESKIGSHDNATSLNQRSEKCADEGSTTTLIGRKKVEKNYSELLLAPFPPEAISWRVGPMTKDKTKTIPLAYITARDVMDRLDSVFGPNGWQTKMVPVMNTVACELSVYWDNVWITRTDTAGQTDIEGEKGAASDALKRAAVQFGIGRYLYNLPNVWVPVDERGKFTPPVLPGWALPKRKGVAADVLDGVEIDDGLVTEAENIVRVQVHKFAQRLREDAAAKPEDEKDLVLDAARGLDENHKVALWNRFDSKQRAFMKKHGMAW